MDINQINRNYAERRSLIQDSTNTIETKEELMDKEFAEYCKQIKRWSEGHDNK